jgi:hypothetical protein
MTHGRAHVLGFALFMATSSAWADRDKAAASYKQGVAAFAHNAFGEAAAAFEAAYAEDPRGASIYNAALSWQGMHEDARAADDFARAMASSDLKQDLLDNAKTQLAKLEAALAKLTIDGPAGARFSVAHASGSVPFEVHVAPGHYVVHATYSDGTSGDFAIDGVAAAAAEVDLKPRAVVTLEPFPTIPVTHVEGVLGTKTLPISLALIGGGVVAGGVAIGLGVATLGAINNLKQSGDTSQSAHDSATSLRAWTDVFFVGALLVGGAGIAALVTVHRVQVRAALGPGSFMLQGTF